jgi:hypothetical protein
MTSWKVVWWFNLKGFWTPRFHSTQVYVQNPPLVVQCNIQPPLTVSSMSKNSMQTLCPNNDTLKSIFKSIKLKASMMSLSKTNWFLISDHKIPKPPKRAVSTTHQTCNGHVSNLNITQLNVCGIRIQLLH